MSNYFAELNNVNVGEHIEKKNGLSYLAWAWAWGEVKKRRPDAFYTIYENRDGWNYHTDGRTCWVKTGVTVSGLEHIEYLPVMDFKNKSIPLENVTSMDVNKAIQRSLTKALARHGLGLYIYAGEDLPEAEQEPCKVELEAAADAVFVKVINDLLEQTGTDKTKFLAYYKAMTVEALTQRQAAEAVKLLEKKLPAEK